MIVVGDGNHFGGIAQKDVDSDNEGIKTIEDTANKLCDTVEMLSS